MKPVNFLQSNINLKRASSMTEEECSSLDVFRDDDGCMWSRWELSPEERAYVLNGGPVWLGVLSDRHPPVKIQASPLFETDENA